MRQAEEDGMPGDDNRRRLHCIMGVSFRLVPSGSVAQTEARPLRVVALNAYADTGPVIWLQGVSVVSVLYLVSMA